MCGRKVIVYGSALQFLHASLLKTLSGHPFSSLEIAVEDSEQINFGDFYRAIHAGVEPDDVTVADVLVSLS